MSFVFFLASNTIYMYFDASSSILTWLSFAGRSLELNWVDLTTKSIHKAPFSGSPLFWHLSPTDPQLLLAHTRGRVMLLHLFGESVGKVTQVFFADVSNSCQVSLRFLFHMENFILRQKGCSFG
jgi:hypothetical protein